MSENLGLGTSIVSGLASIWSSHKADEANEAALDFAKQNHDNSIAYFDRQNAIGGAAFDKAVDFLSAPRTHGTAFAGSASMAEAFSAEAFSAEAFSAEAFMGEAYDMQAFAAEAFQAEMDGFIEAFKSAEGINQQSMDTFSRRYGQVMDNVRQNILDVSQERLSATGREQLSIDARTLANNFDQQLIKKGMGRSGISVEMEQRMAMDTSRQARAIDVNSYDQANQLQSMGAQTLNGMTAQEQQIAMRGENIAQNKAGGLLQGAMQDAALQTNVSMQNAANETLASQINAANRTNVSMANAANKTNVSMQNASNRTNVSLQNAANRTNVSMANASNATNVSLQNAMNATNVSMQNSANFSKMSLANANIDNNQQTQLANLYATNYQNNTAAMSNFYGGVTGSSVTSAYNNQATSYNADAAGYAKLASQGLSYYLDQGDKITDGLNGNSYITPRT